MRTLNVGIVAHVDAGKTSLTERILFESGVLDRLGSVDAGDTQTDTLALERQRGITIRSAVASFVWRDTLVNLVDTPGHSDFIAEVERALAVLDAAVLVVSAVEGVQAQTLVLMRALQRLRLPTLLFVNKLDRAGAEPDRVHAQLAARLTPEVFALGAADRAGTRRAAYVSFGLSASDRSSLAEGTRAAEAHPVVFGSAVTGAGVGDLLDALTDLVPPGLPDLSGPPSGVVFKLERTANGERRTIVRMTGGVLHVRDRVAVHGQRGEKVTGIEVFEPGGRRAADAVGSGRIAVLRGLTTPRIGDRFGPMDAPKPAVEFARPSLETVVDPVDPTDAGRLFVALAELAAQDPLIRLRQHEQRHETTVALYGEVQKEVVAAMLAADHGILATFRPTTPICVERVAGTGASAHLIGVPPNPFLATVGLRVEPAPVGSGLDFALEVELGSMPPAFFAAVREGVQATLTEGVHGWPIPDCRVVMTHSGYWPRQSHSHATFDKAMSSTAGDFRSLARLTLAEALVRAGTVVCAPVHRFELEVPEPALGPVLAELSRHQAVPLRTDLRTGAAVLHGHVPAGHVHAVQQRIPHLTRGEGVFTSALDHYAPAPGAPPTRTRVQPDPFAQIGDFTRVSRGWPNG